MLGRKNEIARMESDFYRDWYHKILLILNVLAIIIVCLILAISYFIIFRPNQPFYATTTEGQIIKMNSSG